MANNRHNLNNSSTLRYMREWRARREKLEKPDYDFQVFDGARAALLIDPKQTCLLDMPLDVILHIMRGGSDKNPFLPHVMAGFAYGNKTLYQFFRHMLAPLRKKHFEDAKNLYAILIHEDYSALLKDYLQQLNEKPSNDSRITEQLRVELEDKHDSLVSVISLSVPNIPVMLGRQVYCLEEVEKLFDGKDTIRAPYTQIVMRRADIKPATEVQLKINELIENSTIMIKSNLTL